MNNCSSHSVAGTSRTNEQAVYWSWPSWLLKGMATIVISLSSTVEIGLNT